MVKDIIFNNISENGIFIDLSIKAKIKLFDSPKEKEKDLYETAIYTDLIGIPYCMPETPFLRDLLEEKGVVVNLTISRIGVEYKVSNFSIREDISPYAISHNDINFRTGGLL